MKYCNLHGVNASGIVMGCMRIADKPLRQTEEVISSALTEVRDTRMKFRAVTEAQEQRRIVNVDIEV